MQRGRGGRDPFFDFGDPFAGFGNIGGFSGQRNLISSVFGGRNPFDDPFFTRPFGGMFEPSFFGSGASPFPDMHPTAYIENQAPEPKRSRGPVIRELNSDDENDEGVNDSKKSKGPIIQELDSDDEKEITGKGKSGSTRKHSRSSKDPYVEDGDDEFQERKSRHLQHRNDYNMSSSIMQQQQPRTRSFTYHSSSVTYGGANGAYYTSSKTRRSGSDGLTIEESKEADSATREATHRLSRGLHNKGHSLTRKLNSDGRVDAMQTLHNLNQDELPVFEEAWNGNARQHLPGWSGSFVGLDNIGLGGSEQHQQVNRSGWALPSTERMQHSGRMFPDARVKAAGSSHMQNVAAMRGSSDVKDENNYTQWRRE